MSQHQFFTVNHGLNIEVELLDSQHALPDPAAFEAEIPSEFKIACEFSHLDSRNEHVAAELAKHDLESVNQVIQAQNQKINVLLNYFLSQQSTPKNTSVTTRFGAGEVSYLSPTQLEIGTLAQISLRLEQPAAAIYTYAKCTDCSATNDGFDITFEYVLIRESDRDILIKAALNQQQKLLRQRSLERDA